MKPFRICKSKGNNTEHVQYLCPLIPNAKERKQNQQPRGVAPPQPSTRSIKSAVSRALHTGASIVSTLTQDTEYSEDESEVRHDYPV